MVGTVIEDGIIQQKVVACNNCINETHKHATFNLATKSALFWQVCDNSQTIIDQHVVLVPQLSIV
jgi:hypothetical protein